MLVFHTVQCENHIIIVNFGNAENKYYCVYKYIYFSGRVGGGGCLEKTLKNLKKKFYMHFCCISTSLTIISGGGGGVYPPPPLDMALIR